MPPPLRTSARVKKRVNYRESFPNDDDEKEEAAPKLEEDDPAPPPKRRKTQSTLVIPQLPSDVWYLVFRILAAQGYVVEIAKCLGLNKSVGNVASRILYQLPVDDLDKKRLSQREVTIFRSYTSCKTVFPYSETVAQIDVNALCHAIRQGHLTEEEIYATIMNIKTGHKGILLPSSAFPKPQIADRITNFLTLNAHKLPMLRSLGVFCMGIGIVLPTVFANLTHLSIESENINGEIGSAVSLGCPKLNSVAISFPFTEASPVRRGIPVGPWSGHSERGAPYAGAMAFLDALPADRLKNFEMGIWTDALAPLISLTRVAEEQAKPSHLRPVGLAYEPSRMLLRSLARHKALKSLGLMRMDIDAYVDLPLLVRIQESLESLYIYLPDAVWGNPYKNPVPVQFKNQLVAWVASFTNLRSLRWVSLDDRQNRGMGNGWTWVEILAYAISHHPPGATDTPLGLQNLSELIVVLGVSRKELYCRIQDLAGLETLHITTDHRITPILAKFQKVLTNQAPHALCRSLVKLPKIQSVTIHDDSFHVGLLWFPWPGDSATRRRGPQSSMRYAQSRSNRVPDFNQSLRELHICADSHTQNLGLWKLICYFPQIRRIFLEVSHDWNPSVIFTWIRATDLQGRAKNREKVKVYIKGCPPGWVIPDKEMDVVEDYAIVIVSEEEVKAAVEAKLSPDPTVRSIRFY